jgi:hypothetical protein
VFLTIAFVLLEPWYHGHHFSLSVFVVVVAILIIGLAIGVRSGQSLVRTAIFVIAMVVIYLTVPRLGVDGTHRLYQNLREKISTLSSPSTSDQLGRKGGGAGRAEVEAFGPMGAAAMPSGHACQASTSTTPRLPV